MLRSALFSVSAIMAVSLYVTSMEFWLHPAEDFYFEAGNIIPTSNTGHIRLVVLWSGEDHVSQIHRFSAIVHS